MALEPVAVEPPAEEPSFLDRLFGRTQRAVAEAVRRSNTRLNHLTNQAEGGSILAIVTQKAIRAGVPSCVAHAAVIRVESG